jgi:hypothetical protein
MLSTSTLSQKSANQPPKFVSHFTDEPQDLLTSKEEAIVGQQLNATSIPPDSVITPAPVAGLAISVAPGKVVSNRSEIRNTGTPTLGGSWATSDSLSTDRKVGFKDIHPILTRKNYRTFNIRRMVGARSTRPNLESSVEAMHLPGIQEALSKLKALGPREQVSFPFIIISVSSRIVS